MKRLLLAVAACSLALPSLTACDSFRRGVVPGPSYVSDQTKLDEQIGITVTLAYTAAAKAAGLAIETGLIKNRDTIVKIGAADQKAYAAVLAVRNAYLAANTSDYTAALAKANAAIAELSALFGSRPTSFVAPSAPTYQAALFGARTAHLKFERTLD